MPHRILFVDDHREFAAASQEFLASKGYEVALAHDGMDALGQIALQTPDLVILDVMMPRLDGWATLESLRQNPATAKLPVLMLTARRSQQDVTQSFAAGCTWYYGKPISDFEDFALVVRQLLECPEAPA
ncbi:MAG TPA: response regulator [Armatimonadota bacterium]